MNIRKLLFLLNVTVIFGCTVTSHTGDPNAPLEVGASCDVATYGIFECDKTGTQILRCEGGHWVLQSDCAADGRVCRESGQTTGCVQGSPDDDPDVGTEIDDIEPDIDDQQPDVADTDHADDTVPDIDTTPDKTIAPGNDCTWLLEQVGATEAYACYGEQVLYCGEWEGAQWRTWGDDCADDGMYCHVSDDYGDAYCASYPADTDPFADVDHAPADSDGVVQPDTQDAVDNESAVIPDIDALATDSDQLMADPVVEQWGSDKEDMALSVAVDVTGNVFVTGRTLGGVDGNTNAGGYDVFLTKWNNTGGKEWTRQWGTINYDYGNAVAVDGAGNVFVTGYTEGSLDGNASLGSDDVFLTKWNADGTKAWTRQWGSDKHEYGHAVVVDSSGAVFVAGRTLGSLPGETSKGGYDIFLTKWDNDGVLVWNEQWGTASYDYGYGCAVDADGNIFVTGYTEGALDGNTNKGGDDVFLTKWNAADTKAWTRQWGSTKHEYGHAVVVDQAGDVYVVGRTLGSIDLNISAGNYDIFVTKWDTTGAKLWTRQWGTGGIDYGYGGAIDAEGALFVTGYVTGSLNGLAYAGAEDVFLSKWDPEGTLFWIDQWGTTLSDKGNGMAIGPQGMVYVAGTTAGTLGVENLGSTDVFLSIIPGQ